MKICFIYRTIFFLFVIILFSLVFSQKISADSILYQDSFSSEESLNHWIIPPDTPGDWTIDNQSLKVFISQSEKYSYIFYKNGDNWVNYSIKMKIISENGVDQNIGFRVKDNENYYLVSFRYFQAEHGGNILLYSSVNNSVNLLESYELARGQLELNNWYNIEIRVENYNIKVYLENEPIFDFNDSSSLFDKGGITLQAWSGNISNLSMRFDEILVESLILPPPILLLPGLGASWNTGAMTTGIQVGDWKLTPFVHIYDNLHNTLTSNGYTLGENYDEFYYDWRKQIDDLSLTNSTNNYLVYDLKEKVDQFYETNGQQKINLVGHSLGGLLARTYTQRYGTEKIDKIVTVGSPHAGAVKAYETWEGAKVIDPERITWADIGMALLLHLNSLKYSTLVETVRNVAPSVKNLIPTFDFLKDTQNADQIIPADSIKQKNQFLFDLNDSLEELTKNLLTTIAGQENDPFHDTLEWLRVKPRTWLAALLGFWEDGEPIERLGSEDGDLTVLLKSASINGVSSAQVIGTHDAIMENSEGLTEILKALDLEITPIATIEATPKLPILAFWLHSPANLKVVNNGTEYFAEEGLILINNAPAGDYEIILTPIGNGGNYHLDIGQITSKGDFWHTLEGNIGNNQQTYLINFDPENPQTIPLVDPQGEELLDQAVKKLEELKAYLENLTISSSTKIKLKLKIEFTLRLLQEVKQDLGKNNYQKAANKLLMALAQIYETRVEIDKFVKQNKLSNEQRSYLKNRLAEVVNLLNRAFVKTKEQGGRQINQQQAEMSLNSAKLLYGKLENKLQNSTQPNPPLGATVLLIQDMLNKADKAFGESNFNQSYINSFGARFLILEANRLR